MIQIVYIYVHVCKIYCMTTTMVSFIKQLIYECPQTKVLGPDTLESASYTFCFCFCFCFVHLPWNLSNETDCQRTCLIWTLTLRIMAGETLSEVSNISVHKAPSSAPTSSMRIAYSAWDPSWGRFSCSDRCMHAHSKWLEAEMVPIPIIIQHHCYDEGHVCHTWTIRIEHT